VILHKQHAGNDYICAAYIRAASCKRGLIASELIRCVQGKLNTGYLFA
jgi:hypothetical protein